MSALVLGGEAAPRFIFAGEELSKNTIFANTDSVHNILGDAVSLYSVSDNLYNSNCLRIFRDEGTGKVLIETTATNLANKNFFASLWVKSTNSIEVKIALIDLNSATTFTLAESDTKSIDSRLQQLWLLKSFGSTVNSKLYLAFEVPPEETLLIYYNSVSEVYSSTIFEYEQEYSLEFEKIVKSKVELLSGELRELIKGWRPKIKFSYDYLTPVYEQERTYISEASNLIVFPRNDSPFHIFALWDGDFKRSYVDKKMVGHSGEITLVGRHLFLNKPVDLGNYSTLYLKDSIILQS